MAKVVCSKCEVDPQIVTDANGDREAVCPECGQSDKVEDAVRIAGEHAVNDAKAMLNEKMRGVARGSKFIKFKSGFTSGGNFRWKAAD